MTSPDELRDLRGDWSGQLVATAIHNGHELRPEIAAAMVLDEATRQREEDPFTDVIGAGDGTVAQVIARRSRFEVDLNRPRDEAVYRSPDDCWGLEVWRDSPLDEELTERSLEVYDAFYADLGERLDEFVEELGGKAVLKPLQGSCGSGVFMVNSKESPNLAQIIEAIARDG